MEADDAAGSDMACQASQHRCGISHELKHVAPDDGVEGLGERHLCRIAVPEHHIADAGGCNASFGGRDGVAGRVSPDDRAFRTDHGGEEKRYVAGPTADVEHLHALGDAGRKKKTSGDRIDQARLRRQSLELGFRMAEHVVSGGGHRFPSLAAWPGSVRRCAPGTGSDETYRVI